MIYDHNEEQESDYQSNLPKPASFSKNALYYIYGSFGIMLIILIWELFQL